METPSRKIPGSTKDENGIYQTLNKPSSTESTSHNTEDALPYAPTKSIEAILKQQLAGLQRLTQILVGDICKQIVTKDTAQQLSTLIKLTMELKGKENELLDNLSDEELKTLAEN